MLTEEGVYDIEEEVYETDEGVNEMKKGVFETEEGVYRIFKLLCLVEPSDSMSA